MNIVTHIRIKGFLHF